MKTGTRIISEKGMTGTVLKIQKDRHTNCGVCMVKVRWDNRYESESWISAGHLTIK